jgi:hypothetical protein
MGAATWGVLPAEAHACGGFFCSQNQPVNQAAERIVFANDGNGTVTAVIQIMYEGPSESFSWLLPSPSVPDEVLVSSDAAFQRLQAATNPNYTLTRSVEGTCKTDDRAGAPNSALSGGATGSTGGGPAIDSGGVTVEASGVVGSFEWDVISVDPDLDQPVDAAVQWLEDNGDVDFAVIIQGVKTVAKILSVHPQMAIAKVDCGRIDRLADRIPLLMGPAPTQHAELRPAVVHIDPDGCAGINMKAQFAGKTVLFDVIGQCGRDSLRIPLGKT